MIKKIAISVALTVLTAPSVYAYGIQGKPNCPNLSQYGNSKYFLSKGMKNKDTQAKRDISELQNFLANKYGLSLNDSVTGYFGKTTEAYVKKYQKENGLTQSGMVGQATRSKLAAEDVCVSNQTSNKPAVYVAGITEKNYIAGTYINLPKNSQLRIVSALTGKAYAAQSTFIEQGGAGTLDIPIPIDLEDGQYYVRAAGYSSPDIEIVRSKTFRIANETLNSYTSDKSFTVLYPNNWRVLYEKPIFKTATSTAILEIKNNVADRYEYDDFNAKIFVLHDDNIRATSTSLLSGIVQKVVSDSNKQDPYYTLVKTQTLSNTSLLAEEVFSGTRYSLAENAKVRVRTVTTPKSMIIFLALDSAWKNHEATFDKIMFNFIK